MKVLSLFDGISCGQLALNRANITVDMYYAAEIDHSAIEITQRNYPNTIQLGNVSNIDFSKFIGDIDIIIGGSPCQDLTIANNYRKGLVGCRSGLFWKFMEAVNIIKPKYFLLENVASMSVENQDIISNALGVEPIYIDSKLVSAQNRRRLYWTNIPNVQQPKDAHIVLSDILETDRSKRLYYIDNNYPRTIKSYHLKGDIDTDYDLIVYEATKLGYIHVNPGKCMDLSVINSKTRRGRAMTNKSNCLLAASTNFYQYLGVDTLTGVKVIRKFTPLECERLQTLPDNYTFGPDARRYKAIGNGWTVDVIAHILKNIEEVAE